MPSLVGGDGSAYVVGQTNSGDFPTTHGAYDTTKNPLTDLFVTKLGLVASGGGGAERARARPGDGRAGRRTPTTPTATRRAAGVARMSGTADNRPT